MKDKYMVLLLGVEETVDHGIEVKALQCCDLLLPTTVLEMKARQYRHTLYTAHTRAERIVETERGVAGRVGE
eukprot:2468555-Rhodomonas_salina.1